MRSPDAPGSPFLSNVDERLWEQAERLIEKHRSFILTTHANPDGDGLGSQAALRHYLLLRGKEVCVANPDPFPANLCFLDPEVQALTRSEGGAIPPLPPAEAVILVDASNWSRMGDLGDRLRDLGLPAVVIDHHPERHAAAGTVRLVDEAACATGELVYQLIARAGGPWSEEIARALYVALLTDTGSFRFANTSSTAHRMAAHLLELGVRPPAVYRQVYEQSSVPQLRLLGEMLAGLGVDGGGRIAWVEVTREMLARAGLRRRDLEGFVNFTGLLAGNEVGVQLVQVAEGEVRVSLRSKGKADVGRVADLLGGGGHEHAAGALLSGTLEQCREEVLARCREALDRDVGGGTGESRG